MPTIIVEDGTGKVDANSYVSVAEADTYFTDRGETGWTGETTTNKEIALILATDYIEVVFGTQFKGNIEFPDTPQALSFPRLNLYDADGLIVEGVPENLKRAQFEYANRARVSALLPDPTLLDGTGLDVTTKRTKVGPIETETQYLTGGFVEEIRSYPKADMLLAEYITGRGRSFRA